MTFTLQKFAVENYFKSSDCNPSVGHTSFLTVFYRIIDIVILRRAY